MPSHAAPPHPMAPGGTHAAVQPREATTLRNDLNIERASLRLLHRARAGDSASERATAGGTLRGGEHLFLTFDFEAYTPCSITVFFAHVSDDSAGAGSRGLTSRLRPLRALGAHEGVRAIFKSSPTKQTFSQLLERPARAGEALQFRGLKVDDYSVAELTHAPVVGGASGAPPAAPSRPKYLGPDGRRSSNQPPPSQMAWVVDRHCH